MKEVYQTTFGTHGNCFSACLASLLEIEIENVPYFMDKGDMWLYEVNAWLKFYDTQYVHLKYDSQDFGYFGNSLVIITGPSPRVVDISHAIIGRYYCEYDNPKMRILDSLFDPHPEGGWIKEPRFIGFLISSHMVRSDSNEN